MFHSHYIKTSGEFSCATAILEDAHIAAREIDRAINGLQTSSPNLNHRFIRSAETDAEGIFQALQARIVSPQPYLSSQTLLSYLTK